MQRPTLLFRPREQDVPSQVTQRDERLQSQGLEGPGTTAGAGSSWWEGILRGPRGFRPTQRTEPAACTALGL